MGNVLSDTTQHSYLKIKQIIKEKQNKYCNALYRINTRKEKWYTLFTVSGCKSLRTIKPLGALQAIENNKVTGSVTSHWEQHNKYIVSNIIAKQKRYTLFIASGYQLRGQMYKYYSFSEAMHREGNRIHYVNEL